MAGDEKEHCIDCESVDTTARSIPGFHMIFGEAPNEIPLRVEAFYHECNNCGSTWQNSEDSSLTDVEVAKALGWEHPWSQKVKREQERRKDGRA